MNTTASARAVTVVPSAVERLPLYHWRPGARVLLVGSRDGADFAANPTADRNTFQRPVDGPLLAAAAAKSGVDGLALAWSSTLAYPAGVAAAQAARPSALVVVTAGVGDPDLLDALLPVVDAWVLLVPTGTAQPLAQTILDHGHHVEVMLGLDGGPLPALPWSCARAVHLTARRAAEADNLDPWVASARAALPATAWIYDHHHSHSDCRSCGERLVWRHGGKSRLDALDGTGACRQCGARGF